VHSEEGADVDARDEDDDLLRAAEELGIDLSGVRAPQRGGASDEAEEKIEAEGEGGQVTTDGDYVTDGGPIEDAQPAEAVASTLEDRENQEDAG
jgi:DNA-directed RNA polymerase subunit beta